jgi:hypothetical protein
VWFPLFLLADNDLTLLANDLRSKGRDALLKATNPGMKRSKTLYLVAIFAWLVAAAGGWLPANAQSFAYVANGRNNTVSAYTIDSTFRKNRAGGFTFFGDINGTKLTMEILPKGKGKYVFAALAKDANLAGTVNPVTIGLTIGDATGSACITAFFE